MAEPFDILVIGAGPGGHAAAGEAARLGARTGIIEKQGWGGTCTHRGCIPTKALLACSRRFAELGKLRRMGVTIGESGFDYAAMKRHQMQISKLSALGVQKSLKDAGVEMFDGEGRIAGPGQVEWTPREGDRRELLARDLIIAWGSEPALPPGVEPSEHILTSDDLLALPTLPEGILIVGGNVIGVEFATLLAELGVRVTLIEMVDQILPGEERGASSLLEGELRKMGVVLHTKTRVETIRELGVGVQLRALPAAGPPLELFAPYALIATGRRPSLREEELNALGIGYDRRGIVVDQELRTSIPGIHAVGDVTGGMMLAHRAMQQGKSLASHLCGGPPVACLEGAVPTVVYTHPQIARVGLTEQEARDREIPIDVHLADFGANIVARITLAGQGFAKLLFHKEKLIGATIAGDQAAELIAPLSLAMAAGIGRRELRNWIIPHPTLTEVLGL